MFLVEETSRKRDSKHHPKHFIFTVLSLWKDARQSFTQSVNKEWKDESAKGNLFISWEIHRKSENVEKLSKFLMIRPRKKSYSKRRRLILHEIINDRERKMWLRIRWRGLMNFLHLHHLPFTTFSAISKCAFLKWRPREKVVLKNNKPHTPLTCGTDLSKWVSVRRSVQRNGWKNGRDWLTTSIIYWRFISPVSSTLCQSVHPSMPKRNG